MDIKKEIAKLEKRKANAQRMAKMSTTDYGRGIANGRVIELTHALNILKMLI